MWTLTFYRSIHLTYYMVKWKKVEEKVHILLTTILRCKRCTQCNMQKKNKALNTLKHFPIQSLSTGQTLKKNIKKNMKDCLCAN